MSFNLSKRIHGVIFKLCKTVGLEVLFYNAVVICLVEINFVRKK
jgi:hypothetical protein